MARWEAVVASEIAELPLLLPPRVSSFANHPGTAKGPSLPPASIRQLAEGPSRGGYFSTRSPMFIRFKKYASRAELT